MKMRFKDKFIKFMAGRNGFDAVVYALAFLYIALAAVNLFVSSYVVYALSVCVWGYIIFRVFSGNKAKRRRENQRFLDMLKKVKARFSLFGRRIKERKTHVYTKCPHCKNMLRLPKREGVNTVRCPCCNESFEVKR
jgi:LSD1 subclass zinc finger protein